MKLNHAENTPLNGQAAVKVPVPVWYFKIIAVYPI